jgi:hypothetical protein
MERKHPAEVFTHCQHEHALDQHGKMKTASELDKKISKLVLCVSLILGILANVTRNFRK